MKNRTMVGALALLALSRVGNGQETVNGGMVVLGLLRPSGSQAVVDFTGAAGTSPVKSGTLAARPGTCSVGQMYFATDATPGQNLAYCTAPGTWTAVAGGGGSGNNPAMPATTNLLGGDGNGGAIDSQISAASPYSVLRAGVVESRGLGLGFAAKYSSLVMADFQAAATSQRIKLGTAAAGWMMSGARLAETASLVSASSNVTAVTACLGTAAAPCAFTPGGLALLGTAGQFWTWPGPYSAAAGDTATQDVYLTLTVTNPANPGNLGVSGLSVSSCTNTNPAVCTVTGHGFKSGSNPTVTVAGATGAWSVLNGTYGVAYAGANTLTMTGVNGASLGALSGTVTLGGSYIQAGQVAARIWGSVAQ